MKIDNKNYWNGIDEKLQSLIRNGFVKLPSLNNYNLNTVSENISKEMGSLTFKELSFSHEKFLKDLEMDKYLVPKLYKIARQLYNFKGELSDQYHIARKVYPGNLKEQFRAHFDSHLFTIVFPIKIPLSSSGDTNGDLIYFSNIRNMPGNELVNMAGKIYFKKFASKDGIQKLMKNHKYNKDNFINYQPLLFLGKTTLHSNYPVSNDCSSYRLTLLAHFFDTSTKLSPSNFLRLLRNR